MRLIYLRVLSEINESSVSLLNKDINFLGSHQFYWDADKKDIGYRRIDSYFPNLYGNSINVSVITGANGTGKTTLLDFINYLIAGYNGNTERVPWFDSWSWVCLIEEEGDVRKYHQEFMQGVEGNFNERPLFPKGEIPKARFKLDSRTVGSELIYFSPHLSFSSIFNASDRVDVSADAVFNQAMKDAAKLGIPAKQSLKSAEIKIQVDFIEFLRANNNLVKELPFLSKIRNSILALSLEGYNNEVVTERLQIINAEEDYSIYRNAVMKIERLIGAYQSREPQKKLKYSIFKYLFELRLLTVLYINFDTYLNSLKGKLREKFVSRTNEYYDRIPPEDIGITIFGDLQFLEHDKLKTFMSAVSKIYQIFEGKDVSLAGSIHLPRLRTSTGVGEQLLRYEREVLSTLRQPNEESLGFFFDWVNLSTGEKAYLNLFSRFYRARKLTSNNSDEAKTYFLIDEPSTAFHPQWQKEYLDKLLRFIDTIFKGSKEVILTTHSPYVVSDVQKEDIIPLQMDSKSPTLFSTNTFGANIHELLANSFFLQNGFMGDVARKKIKSLLDFFGSSNKEQYSVWDQEKARRFIDIIGEPLLKRDLMQLYYESVEEDELDQEIERLEQIKRNRKGKNQ